MKFERGARVVSTGVIAGVPLGTRGTVTWDPAWALTPTSGYYQVYFDGGRITDVWRTNLRPISPLEALAEVA